MTTSTPRDRLDMERQKHDQDVEFGKKIAKIVVMTVLALLLIFAGYRVVAPQLTLYRISTERKAQVAEARAKAEAAEYLADAEVERAKGVAAANREIASSITEEYIRWLYVDQLDQIDGQVIYVPTEGGIPVLEAGRSVTTPATGG